ncbi:MAG: hypothetical protein Q9162_000429 [Coniocarpon cinnabarinum]
MPPKRGRKRAAPSPRSDPRERKAHEIHEAFRLFAISHSNALEQAEDEDDEGATQELEEHADDENGLLRVLDVRRALKSLNLPPPPSDFFDEGQRFLSFDNFKELAQTMGELQDEGDHADEGMDDIEVGHNTVRGKGKEKKVSKQQRERAEIDHAFALFTTPIPSSGKFEPGVQEGRKISLADLKRVARELREDVDDSVLKTMLLEANGGEGNGGVLDGVGREEFESVMKRAGVFA